MKHEKAKTNIKKIVYFAADNGVDGRGPETILYASFEEEELKKMLEADSAKAWRTPKEKIVDINVARKAALGKLDGIDRLVLDLPAWSLN